MGGRLWPDLWQWPRWRHPHRDFRWLLLPRALQRLRRLSRRRHWQREHRQFVGHQRQLRRRLRPQARRAAHARLPPSLTPRCPWPPPRPASSTTSLPTTPTRSCLVLALVPSVPRLPRSPLATATSPSTRCTTPRATSLSSSPSLPPTPTTSTSRSAPTVALATAPPASAAASRATPTTTATPRTCSPLKFAATRRRSSTAGLLARTHRVCGTGAMAWGREQRADVYIG